MSDFGIVGVCMNIPVDLGAEAFVKSARRNGYKGDIVIIADDDEVSQWERRFAKEYDVDISSGHVRPAKFFLGRWSLYLGILESYYWDYVLLSDIRDVIIQDDLDRLRTIGLNVTQESVAIEQEEYNSAWVRDGYGDEALNRIKDLPVLCAGTVWGSRISLINLCRFMQERGRAMDQGALNYAVYHNVVPAYRYTNGDLVWTLGMEGYDSETKSLKPLCYRVHEGRVVMCDGPVARRDGPDGSEYFFHVPPIIHQYDRHESLKKDIHRIYGIQLGDVLQRI